MRKLDSAIAWLLLGLASNTGQAACDHPIGATEYAHLEAKGGCGTGAEQQELEHGAGVRQGWKVVTNQRGIIDFIFFNSARVLIGPECDVKLDEAYYDRELDRSIRNFSVYEATRCLIQASNATASNDDHILLQTPLATIEIVGADAFVFYAPGQGRRQSQNGAGWIRSAFAPADLVSRPGSGGGTPPARLLLAATSGQDVGREAEAEFDRAADALADRYELVVVKLSAVGDVLIDGLATRQDIRRAEFMVWKSKGGSSLEGPARADSELLSLLQGRLEGLSTAAERPQWHGEYVLRGSPASTGREPWFTGPTSCLDTGSCPRPRLPTSLSSGNGSDRPPPEVPPTPQPTPPVIGPVQIEPLRLGPFLVAPGAQPCVEGGGVVC